MESIQASQNGLSQKTIIEILDKSIKKDTKKFEKILHKRIDGNLRCRHSSQLIEIKKIYTAMKKKRVALYQEVDKYITTLSNDPDYQTVQ